MRVIHYLAIGFFLSTQSLTVANPIESDKQAWAISERIQDVLGTFSAREVPKALQSFGIQATLLKSQDYLMKYKILEGKHFNVYLAPRAFENDQVWIMANPGTPTLFEELTADQLKELESFRYLMGEVLLNHLNYDGYVSFINAEKNYGLNRPTLCLEILPAKYEGKNRDQVDILGKLERVWYVLYGAGKELFFSPKQAKDKIEKMQTYAASLKNRGATLSNQKRLVKNSLPWSRKLINLEKLKHYCLQEFQRELVEAQDLFLDNPKLDNSLVNHHPITESHNEGEFTQTEEKELEITKCAFCNPKVIENQQVLTSGDFVGLYNFRPYITGYHFMITPNMENHVESWQYLSLDDVVKADQLAQAFVKAIKKDSGRNDVVLFLQNGFAGGMTVPHGHLHVLLKPPALRLITMNLLEVTGHDVEGIRLKPEQLKGTREKFKALVEEFIYP